MSVTADVELGIGAQTLAVSLTADNQAVTVAANVVLSITSDNTTATNRTFTLSAPAYDGQKLYLAMVSGSNTTCDLQIASTLKISAAWQPLQYDTLHLIGVGGVWYELGRSDNSP